MICLNYLKTASFTNTFNFYLIGTLSPQCYKNVSIKFSCTGEGVIAYFWCKYF